MKKRIHRLLVLGLMVCALGLGGCQKANTEEQNNYRQYGINCLQNGNYEEAITAFDRALDQGGGRISKVEIDICYYKAEAQYLNGDLAGAEETYNSIIDYDDIAEAYYLRGCLYSGQDRWEEAKKDFETAAGLEEEDIALYIGIYEAFAAHNLEEEGKEYLEKALQIEGESAEDHMHRGRGYLLQGDTGKAMECLTKSIEEGCAEANFYMAEVYAALGDLENADVYFTAYRDSGTPDSYDLYEMGKRQMKSGDYAHAISYFEAALEMEKVPNKQILMKDCAIAYERQGDFASAREMLKEYMELYPSDEGAERELSFLESR